MIQYFAKTLKTTRCALTFVKVTTLHPSGLFVFQNNIECKGMKRLAQIRISSSPPSHVVYSEWSFFLCHRVSFWNSTFNEHHHVQPCVKQKTIKFGKLWDEGACVNVRTHPKLCKWGYDFHRLVCLSSSLIPCALRQGELRVWWEALFEST